MSFSTACEKEKLPAQSNHHRPLFQPGARNFLLFTITPFDCPLPAGKPGPLELHADITHFNTLLTRTRTLLLSNTSP